MNVIFLIVVFVISVEASKKKNCQQCIPVQDCRVLDGMSRAEQERWFEDYSCQTSQEEDDEEISFLYGFAPFAKGDYVCCPDSNSDNTHEIHENIRDKNSRPRQEYDSDDNRRGSDWNKDPSDIGNSRPNFENKFGNNNRRPSSQQRPISHENTGSFQNSKRPATGNTGYQRPSNQQTGYNFGSNGGQNNGGLTSDNFYRPGSNNFDNRRPNTHENQNQGFQNSNKGNQNLGQGNRNPNNFNPQNRRPTQPIQTESPYFMGRPTTYRPNFRGSEGSRRTDNAGLTNVQNQCQALTSFPPSIDSGCCGRDDSGEEDRIIATQRPRSFARAPSTEFLWPSDNFQSSPSSNRPNWFPSFNFFSSSDDKENPLVKRAIDNQSEVVNITLDNRIAGGKATIVGQFPWLVLLKSIFDYGTELQAFNCGGSLISATYVLTAGHCLFDAEAPLSDVEITLAEHDKRTFPNDCTNDEGGRRCIKNIRVHAADVIIHQDYDDTRLQNDIALIRLRSRAPYTEFIRPICLPPIDIDSPEFSNLPLHVAGWGRNGVYNSNVKQSTVVNLVPQRDCKRSYSFLTRRHVCAAGYSGEDTCKGDSGGPLMLFYEGKYFVSGVVSGKRADSPCGTSVPSLYTNVYHYLDWIKSNIRN